MYLVDDGVAQVTFEIFLFVFVMKGLCVVKIQIPYSPEYKQHPNISTSKNLQQKNRKNRKVNISNTYILKHFLFDFLFLYNK